MECPKAWLFFRYEISDLLGLSLIFFFSIDVGTNGLLEQEAESLEKRVLCSPITYQSCAWILENGGIKWINHSRDYLSRSQQPLCTTISYCIRARAIRQILASAALRLDANIMMYSPHTNVITSLLHDHKCQSIVLALLNNSL